MCLCVQVCVCPPCACVCRYACVPVGLCMQVCLCPLCACVCRYACIPHGPVCAGMHASPMGYACRCPHAHVHAGMCVYPVGLCVRSRACVYVPCECVYVFSECVYLCVMACVCPSMGVCEHTCVCSGHRPEATFTV